MRRAVTLLAAMGVVILLAGAMVLLTSLGPNGVSRAEAQPSESTDQQQATSQQRATAETKSGVLNLRYGNPKLGPDGDPMETGESSTYSPTARVRKRNSS